MRKVQDNMVHSALPIESKTSHDDCMLYIRFGPFLKLRGILISLSGDTIRVALEGHDDAVEFRRVSGGWISEQGESVEIEWQEAADAGPFRPQLKAACHRPAAESCVA